MASRDMEQASSSSFSASDKWKYDVFLSFRGEDTRKNFTDHLYAALLRRGITTFKDDQKGVKGNTISTEILQAIQVSRFLVVIFSRNYASSTWCLDELLQISESSTGGTQTVFPVFYGVDPSAARKQTGVFGKAFSEHEVAFKHDLEKVQRWRTAMTKVANLFGWHLQDRCETEFIQGIVEEISKKLSHRFSSVAKDLVGVDKNVEEIISFLGTGLDDVYILGICGMGGIGKTTIARVVYEKLSNQFEGSSFLANVREVHEKRGLVPLQEQLLSETLVERNVKVWNVHSGANEIRNRLCHKSVLLIIDDVDQLYQLKSLAGARDWFGSGSRIIITTRDERLLIGEGVDKICRIEGLDSDEALKLFCLKAFKNDYPEKAYVELSYQAVDYASGLPLALAVLGSFLFGRSVNEWKSALLRLKEIPSKEILDKLQISFDGLEEVEKKIFLDIACFFKGKKKNHVTRILDCCGFYPDIGLSVLLDRSLITISENRVWMHDLLQEMGQEIVRRSFPEEPGKRSRLWLYKDICHVFMKNSGTEQVEVMAADLTKQDKGYLSPKAFLMMKRLRMLKLKNFPLSQVPEYLSDELHYLEWHGYPFKSLPPNFQTDKLMELNMRHSHIKELWKGRKNLEMLKLIDLSHSHNLVRTPDFGGLPNLESLKLEGCTRLSDVHQSIGALESLVLLNLKDCKSLVSLPSSICDLKSLKILILSGCINLDKLPEKLGYITCLEELHLGRTNIKQLPSSVAFLSRTLRVISFRGSKGTQHKSWDLASPFRTLPRQKPIPVALMLPSLSAFHHLRKLDLSDCNLMDGSIPNDLSCFSALETLNLSGNDFESLPESICTLSKLEVLIVDKCKRLVSFPELPPDISFVSMHDCSSLETLPTAAYDFSKSFQFFFTNCPNLIDLQRVDFFSWVRRDAYLSLKKNPQGVLRYSLSEIGSFAGWFDNQAVGSSLRIQLPPHWCNDYFKGFAFFASYAIDEHAINDCNEDDDLDFLKLQCFLRPNIVKDHSGPLTLSLPRKGSGSLARCWLGYATERIYAGGTDWWNKCSHIDVTFTATARGVEVKRCGVRLIYDHDIEWLNSDDNLTDS